MLIQILPATLSDLDDLTRLNRDVQDAHVRMYPDLFRADWDAAGVKEFWRLRVQDRANAVAIAKLDAIAVGYIWFEIQERLADPFTHGKRRIRIHHVSMDLAWRRHGVGSALFDHVEAPGSPAGCNSRVQAGSRP
jgi:GNAT superfamily N-acetyltransferase